MTTAIASAIAATRAMVRMRRKWFAASATKSATSFTKSAASLTNSASASTNVRSSGGSVSVVAKLRTGDRNRSNRSETILFFMLHYNSPCEFLTCNVSLLVLHMAGSQVGLTYKKMAVELGQRPCARRLSSMMVLLGTLSTSISTVEAVHSKYSIGTMPAPVPRRALRSNRPGHEHLRQTDRRRIRGEHVPLGDS